jgi:hypothetical protein
VKRIKGEGGRGGERRTEEPKREGRVEEDKRIRRN